MVACSGSGRESEVAFAPPQTLPLGWRELDGDHGRGFRLEVRSLRITHDRWAVEASVTNRTGVSYVIDRPHVPKGRSSGSSSFAAATAASGRGASLRGA